MIATGIIWSRALEKNWTLWHVGGTILQGNIKAHYYLDLNRYGARQVTTQSESVCIDVIVSACMKDELDVAFYLIRNKPELLIRGR